MRKVLGIIVCVGLTGCTALRVDKEGDGANVLSLRLGTFRHEDVKAAPCDEGGMGGRESYEGYLTTSCPQGMAPSVAPAHTVQAVIQGPNGPSMAYLQFPDADPSAQGGYGWGMPRMPSQPPVVQTAVNGPAPVDDPGRTLQNELTMQICQQVVELKQQVQDLTSQVKTRHEPARDGAVEAIAANLAVLNKKVNNLNENLASLKATQEQTAAAPQEAPAAAAATPAASPVRPVSAQSVQPAPLLAANEPMDLSQNEINRLVTQCLCELKAEIHELNNRLANIPGGAAKPGE